MDLIDELLLGYYRTKKQVLTRFFSASLKQVNFTIRLRRRGTHGKIVGFKAAKSSAK